MTRLQPVRGTRDLLPEDSVRQRVVTEIARTVVARSGFAEIATPIFEFTEVFERTLGDTSDIVTKEMYTFADRGGESLTLRPENTAGVARAVISGGLVQDAPLKYFYSGPMFRYERPQKGRLRQFHQIGIELIGVGEPLGDVEIITLAGETLAAIGVLDQTRLELNSLGDAESRQTYRDVLVDYFSAQGDALSEDSRARLNRNPLRILDSKDEADRPIIRGAPLIGDSLNAESSDFFAAVRAGLDAAGIAYEVSPRLVRGLDYYCHTAFEFTTQSLGSQGAVIAGGRYDGLIESMGGPATSGVGWAGGIERLAMMLPDAPVLARPIALVPIGSIALEISIKLGGELRAAGLAVDLGYRGTLAKRLKRANKVNARAAVLIGEDELATNSATLRDLDTGYQENVPLDELVAKLTEASAA